MPYIVALTGGIGSGKSTVSWEFSRRGINVVDTDLIARSLMEPGQPALIEVVKRFGRHILDEAGSLNRSLLRRIIFESQQDRNWLNQLLHPMIRSEAQEQLARSKSAWSLWVVPLLVENKLETKADRILVIDVDPSVQCNRTMMRDQVSRGLVENILAVQASREARLSIADDVIDNNGDLDALSAQISVLHQRYLSLSRIESA